MNSSHDNNFDSLRALAVIGVIFHHIYAHTGYRLPLFAETGGLLGVQLFFIISGFLIVQSATKLPLKAYLLRRFFRIFPSYWVATVLVGTFLSQKSPFFLLTDGWLGLLHLFALSHLSPPALLHHDVLTVSWTLTIEWFWYLLVPLLVVCIPQARERTYWLSVVVLLSVLSSVWVATTQTGKFDWLLLGGARAIGENSVTDFLRFAFLVNAFPAQLGFFALGAGIWRYQNEILRFPAWLLALVFCIFVFFATYWNGLLGLNPSLASGFGLAALVLLALKYPPLKSQAIKWVGSVSYPLYLLHVPAIFLVFQHFKITGWHGILVAFIVMTLGAYLLNILVERPGIRFAKIITSSNKAIPMRKSYS